MLKQVVDAAMAAAERAGLAWSRPQEIKRVVATILSQYRNMSILLRTTIPQPAPSRLACRETFTRRG